LGKFEPEFKELLTGGGNGTVKKRRSLNTKYSLCVRLGGRRSPPESGRQGEKIRDQRTRGERFDFPERTPRDSRAHGTKNQNFVISNGT